MNENGFNRDSMARTYAARHLNTDSSIREIYYLPESAPEREIRIVEINDAIFERNENPLEALDFGVDIDSQNGHTLLVLDVTLKQWEKIDKRELQLPCGWSLEKAIKIDR